MIKKFLNIISGTNQNDDVDYYRSLMRQEAVMGGQLFGPVPADRRREFFCLDKNTWIWHEEWTDASTGERKARTTRYDVRPSGILKAQSNGTYHKVSADEAKNLVTAAKIYIQRSLSEFYGAQI
ncbi:hypothetical protein KC930_03720 [Candidatus Saccharibacteria bacterium]|nr:hypothetical protein [Candidatus Saccharibacteria bacterium]